MNKELEQKLYDKYPKIFAEKDLPMSKTCMCWGICCGDGWYTLLDALCHVLQSNTNNNGHPQVVATQVKEKFGTLRFYVRGCDDFQNGAIWLAESLSGTICEDCGAPANTSRRTNRGWVCTLCDKCFEKANNEVMRDV